MIYDDQVRRERISERMKQLQALVPGCDKVLKLPNILSLLIIFVSKLIIMQQFQFNYNSFFFNSDIYIHHVVCLIG